MMIDLVFIRYIVYKVVQTCCKDTKNSPYKQIYHTKNLVIDPEAS